MLDAVLITSQPYNSSNTLANSVGYAMWNNVLYNKVGTLWKISSSGANYNPCSVDSAYDVTDYTNLRCINNYTYDSGWKYIQTVTNISLFKAKGNYSFVWEGNHVCTSTTSSCVVGNSTYYGGAKQPTEGADWFDYYAIKKVDNLVEYKSFSSF